MESINMFTTEDHVAHHRKRDGEIQELANHLKEVSNMAGEFAALIGLKNAGELIGLLHDLGKASREFRQYIESAVGLIDPDEDDYVDATKLKGKVDHSTAGAQLIYKHLSIKRGEGQFVAQVLSLCIASHHSGLIDCVSPDGADLYSKRLNKREEKAHTREVFDKINGKNKKRIMAMLESKEFSQNILNCFKALKSNQDSNETLAFKRGLLLRLIYSCLIDADRLNTVYLQTFWDTSALFKFAL